ncbi:MAG: DUF4416 family protein [Desulfobacteraceae bacterium]|nr:DUF4416 family protein [Desulfobacteraceae bacterium]
MSTPKVPDPAKLVISVFMKDKQVFDQIFDGLERIAGPVDIISKWLDFDFTDYYYKEMGSPLYRRMIAFKPLIDQEKLASIKIATNALEKAYLSGGGRRVNIDPGYLLSSRFVLATGKEYSHRIYIGKNIYADLTLIYTKKGFKILEWTYPDYASDEVTGFLGKVRNKYLLDLKERKK